MCMILDEQLSFVREGATFYFVKGEKTSEELLKEGGFWHEDELQIVTHSVNDLSSGFFEISYEIKNNTEEKITFKGISMEEYDVNNTIINSYYSYNKNAIHAELEPQQSVLLKLTFSADDPISIVESKKYRYTAADGTLIEGQFSTPYQIQL